MRVKLTHPTEQHQAGVIAELPEDEAQELISKDWAFQIVDEQPAEKPVKKVKVKNGNW